MYPFGCAIELARFAKVKIILILFLDFEAVMMQARNTNEDVLRDCPTQLSCKGRCSLEEELENATRFAPHCHCDSYCKRYEDCCADYDQFCANKNRSISAVPKLACVMTESNKGVWMVAACRKNWPDDDTKRKCLDGSKPNRTLTHKTIEEDVPVWDILTDLHYRNKYCAICNDLDADLFEYWDLRIRCNIKPPEEYSFTEQIDFLLKYCPTRQRKILDITKRRFCYNIVSTCPKGETSDHRTRCEQGPARLVTRMEGSLPKKNYKNIDCLMCNGHQRRSAVCGPRDTHGNIFKPKSFEVLIQAKGKAELKFHQTCQRNYVYDKHLQICRLELYKMDPFEAVSDKYRFKLWLSPSDGAQPINFTDREFVYGLTQVVELSSSQVEVRNLREEDNSMAVTFDVHALPTNLSDADQKNTTVLKKIRIQELLERNTSFFLTINRKKWLAVKLTWRQLACVRMDKYLPGEFMLFPSNNSMLINKTKEIIPVSAYYLKEGEGKYDARIAYVCRSTFTAFCSHHFVTVKQEEFTILANHSLYHNRTGTQFPVGEYYIDGSFGVICTNDTDKYASVMHRKTESVPESNVLRYMTIIGLSVSVLSLLLVLFAHILLPELRSPLPGKNLMNLSLSLLLAHFLFLLGSGDTDQPTFCHVTAVALHWLFLVSFSCMAVIAHDTRATFSRKMSNIHGGSIGHSHRTRFLINTAIAWGVPLLLVAVCVLLDRLSIFDIGYGGKVACWIAGDGKESQRNAQLVIFAAPVALALVYNVIAFSQTIWAITVARQQTKRLNKAGHNNPNMVKIYIRLLSLMGFSWFFGISAPYIHEGLMYPFVFFSTLQGLYLFIAFVCKARVWRMCKVSFSRMSQKTPRSTTYTTSTRAESGRVKATKLVEESVADSNM